MKKFFFTVLSLILLVFGVGYGFKLYKLFDLPTHDSLADPEYCAFCNKEVIQSQKIYENEWVVALINYRPITEGHILILPKRHVERYEMLLEEELLQVNRVIKKVHEMSQRKNDAFSYLLLQKNGREVGQDVPHVHFHYIPQKIHSRPQALLWKFFTSPLESPMSREEVQALAADYSQEFTQENPNLVGDY